MFIPAITGRSWLTKSYFTNVIHLRITVLYVDRSEAFLCGFYATYAMFL